MLTCTHPHSTGWKVGWCSALTLVLYLMLNKTNIIREKREENMSNWIIKDKWILHIRITMRKIPFIFCKNWKIVILLFSQYLFKNFSVIETILINRDLYNNDDNNNNNNNDVYVYLLFLKWLFLDCRFLHPLTHLNLKLKILKCN